MAGKRKAKKKRGLTKERDILFGLFLAMAVIGATMLVVTGITHDTGAECRDRDMKFVGTESGLIKCLDGDQLRYYEYRDIDYEFSSIVWLIFMTLGILGMFICILKKWETI